MRGHAVQKSSAVRTEIASIRRSFVIMSTIAGTKVTSRANARASATSEQLMRLKFVMVSDTVGTKLMKIQLTVEQVARVRRSSVEGEKVLILEALRLLIFLNLTVQHFAFHLRWFVTNVLIA